MLITAIVLAGLVAMSIHGDTAYFGRIQAEALGWHLWWPGMLVAVLCGLVGGLFSRLLIQSLRGGHDRFSLWRRTHPLRFAAGCGLAVAVIGLACGGSTFGSGYQTTQALLHGQHDGQGLGMLMRLVSTWLSLWSGVPGGVFAPSLAIGAELGAEVAQWTGHSDSRVLIALGMAGFLAATTQAPITAFIIVMEMLEGHALILSLMACTMIASAIARLLSPSMYHALAVLQQSRLSPPTSTQAEVAEGHNRRHEVPA
ncbi:MAG: chloride channel protein [Aquabacterium sp.]